MSRSLEEYLALPYHLRLVQDAWEDGTIGWFIEVEELPGCMSQGRTVEEAVGQIRDAMAGWISVGLQDGKEIPEPRAELTYSGRFLLRVPKSLHGALSMEAEREQVSLNQYCVAALAYVVGLQHGTGERVLV
jgi:antitoxin HicB